MREGTHAMREATESSCFADPIPSAVPSAALVWRDVLSQAVTGEIVAAMNYTSLSEIGTCPDEAADALEHAAIERRHAAAFAAEGRKLGLDVPGNLEARHWKNLRGSFARCVAERDVVGCLIVQEIMLESVAVATYSRVAKVAPGSLGRTFGAIAAEEERHVEHALAALQAVRARDSRAFDDLVHRLHVDVMTTLAEMLARDCARGHCEACRAECVKPSLFQVRLSAPELRGAALQQYLRTLDKLGLPGERTLVWVSQLPV